MNVDLGQLFGSGLVELWVLLAFLWGVLVLIVNVVLAVFVAQDAARMRRRALGIPPALWFLAVLGGSVFGVLGYWLMNRSTLVPAGADEPPARAPTIRHHGGPA